MLLAFMWLRESEWDLISLSHPVQPVMSGPAERVAPARPATEARPAKGGGRGALNN